MASEIDNIAYIVLDPRFGIKRVTKKLTVKLYAVVDTSGSMFANIEAATGVPSHAAYEEALSVVFEVIRRIMSRGIEVDGYLGFFSDKHSGFICGTGETCITLSEYIRRKLDIYVDYLSLRGVTPADLRPREIAVKTTTGGTNPNPLIKHLIDKHGLPDLMVIVTDGYTPAIETHDIDTVIYIVPGGTEPEVRGRRYTIIKLSAQ